MISSGKMGANASGPTGSLVAGFSGGSSPNGRSGTILYQPSGISFSASKNFVVSTKTSGFLAAQLVGVSACQLTGFSGPTFGDPQARRAAYLDEKRARYARARRPTAPYGSSIPASPMGRSPVALEGRLTSRSPTVTDVEPDRSEPSRGPTAP